MSIQPINKPAKHLINSTPVLEKKEAVNAYLIKNSKGLGWVGRGYYHMQSEGLGGVLCHSPSYNYFKVCTKFTLEGPE